ncbi:F0F1 ATP synthase subunit delta [Lichenihabitans sp. PAMC28606]|uniref:F0F1 ATP synthase subunit delta n=2 Tax=Lichenihabitans TaxID=2723776 RepID=UPI00103840BB|nr:F0F1 ATP synthase subunit delta [Lichenihabitans psoromatis]UDL94779.1 F0F1 ATP synthase subunit delta [Lichenihabitans sp. PAMC28606]
MAAVETIVSGMAGRYALALFDLAKDSNAIDQVAGDLNTFGTLIDESADLQLLVRSPVFSADEQTRALREILSHVGINGLAANFLKLVASKRRLFAVRGMIADYNKLVDAEKNVTRAQITVAEPLSDQHLADLKAALHDVTGGQTVALDVDVDPEILGGLIVRLGSRMVDGSLKTKLNTLRTRMKEVG